MCCLFSLAHNYLHYLFFGVHFVLRLFEQTCLLGKPTFGLPISLILLDVFRMSTERWLETAHDQLSGAGEDGAGKMESATWAAGEYAKLSTSSSPKDCFRNPSIFIAHLFFWCY